MAETVVIERVSAEERRYHVRFFLGYGASQDPSRLCEVNDIPGVESRDIGKYSVVILKGKLFDWEEIDPKVVAILEASAPSEVPA